jgi:hypothetical protein
MELRGGVGSYRSSANGRLGLYLMVLGGYCRDSVRMREIFLEGVRLAFWLWLWLVREDCCCLVRLTVCRSCWISSSLSFSCWSKPLISAPEVPFSLPIMALTLYLSSSFSFLRWVISSMSGIWILGDDSRAISAI